MDESLVATIVCPQCHAVLDASAEVCHRCGTATYTGAATVSAMSQPTRATKQGRLIDKPWLIVVVLLHVGLLGIPMYWKTDYSLGVRLAIVMMSIVYTVVAVGLIVLMLWWIWQSTAGLR